MEFILFVGGFVLLILVLSTRTRLEAQEDEIRRLANKLDSLQKQFTEKTEADAAPKPITPYEASNVALRSRLSTLEKEVARLKGAQQSQQEEAVGDTASAAFGEIPEITSDRALAAGLGNMAAKASTITIELPFEPITAETQESAHKEIPDIDFGEIPEISRSEALPGKAEALAQILQPIDSTAEAQENAFSGVWDIDHGRTQEMGGEMDLEEAARDESPAQEPAIAAEPLPDSIAAETATEPEPELPRSADKHHSPAGAIHGHAEPIERIEIAPPELPGWLIKAKEWLFDGNLVTKIGLLILFIGVSFLLKFVAVRVTVPIELRLAGIVLADIGLLLWGWRIREKRPSISLPIQGGAIGILMLVTFASFRLYDLIPGSLAFALLFVLTLVTCILAVLQDAIWLAVFGIIEGFAAPVLTSTGHGSHIGLFSYYALLNAGILAIALKRSWRLLNLLGFAFTFSIGTTWGVLRYEPEFYTSVQAFLILFFVFYVAIAILYANRQAMRLKHYVDGTLVFGTPMAAFGLQYAIIRDTSFGLAFSALALGLFYIGVTSLLWRRRGGSLRLLVESFLALGVVFGTLAVPLAFDGRWTSTAWALEGAGIVWAGLRQKRVLAWAFGLLVQLGAWISFIVSMAGLDAGAAAKSNLWLGFLLLAVSGFLMALSFRQEAARLRHDEETGDSEMRPTLMGYPSQTLMTGLATSFLGSAAFWLLAGAWTEIFLRADAWLSTLLVLSAMAVSTILLLIAKRLDWAVSRYFALAPQLAAWVAFLASMTGLNEAQALKSTLWLGFLMLAIGAFLVALNFHREATRLADGKENPSQPRITLFSSLFLGVAALWLLAGAWTEIFLRADIQTPTLLALSALAVAALLMLIAKRLDWTVSRYFALAPQVLAGLAFLSLFIGSDLLAALSSGKLDLIDSNFFGALLITLGAAATALSFHRREEASETPALISRCLLGWTAFWWLACTLVIFSLWSKNILLRHNVISLRSLASPLHPLYCLLLACTTPAIAHLSQRLRWPDLRWLAAAVWPGLLFAMAMFFSLLLENHVALPRLLDFLAVLALWLAGEWLLENGEREGWLSPKNNPAIVRVLHTLRIAGPWLILWPLVRNLVGYWLHADVPEPVASGDWFVSGSWSLYLPAWVAMAYVALLIPRTRAKRWPAWPIAGWYRNVLIPIGAACALVLAVCWNFTQNGRMDPLPYLPLLNPLDLTTAFAALLAVAAWRLRAQSADGEWRLRLTPPILGTAYVWFNLMLLRTGAYFLGIPYQIEPLFRSQFIQAMLSLVWCASALVLMRLAAKRLLRFPWMAGAALLALVVAKLFLVDLSSVGSIERIVSFLGVGVLMLAIGYLAPYPTEKSQPPE